MGSNTAPWDVSHRWTPLHPAQGPQHCALGPPAAKQAEAASKAEPAAHFFCSGSNQHAGGFLVGQFLCVHSELDLHAPEVRCSQSERLQQQEEQRCPKGSRAGWLSSAGAALAERFKAVTFSIAPFANMIHPRLCAFWSRIWRASVLPRLANYPLFVS